MKVKEGVEKKAKKKTVKIKYRINRG